MWESAPSLESGSIASGGACIGAPYIWIAGVEVDVQRHARERYAAGTSGAYCADVSKGRPLSRVSQFGWRLRADAARARSSDSVKAMGSPQIDSVKKAAHGAARVRQLEKSTTNYL